MSSEKKEDLALEMQELEHSLQNLLMQRQTLELELEETKTAIFELEKTEDEVFKIIGGVLIKSEKNELIKELSEKKRLSELKLSSVEKQEASLQTKAESLRQEFS